MVPADRESISQDERVNNSFVDVSVHE